MCYTNSSVLASNILKDKIVVFLQKISYYANIMII
jgi:hypothetical protein